MADSSDDEVHPLRAHPERTHLSEQICKQKQNIQYVTICLKNSSVANSEAGINER
jgi:hypothetical protein